MKETLIVERVIKWWVKKQNLEFLPLVALGASSGGYFVSMLASKMRLVLRKTTRLHFSLICRKIHAGRR
ncbi:hypothetical protein Hanom_Chr08g00700451 [Helianthus anomalus]